jgi:hypothetical protein
MIADTIAPLDRLAHVDVTMELETKKSGRRCRKQAGKDTLVDMTCPPHVLEPATSAHSHDTTQVEAMKTHVSFQMADGSLESWQY